jgi:hypothetical protein
MNRVYWINLTQIRFYEFTIGYSFLVFILLAWMPPLAIVVVALYFPLSVWYWLTVQMKCNECRAMVRVKQTRCRKCGAPTDNA